MLSWPRLGPGADAAGSRSQAHAADQRGGCRTACSIISPTCVRTASVRTVKGSVLRTNAASSVGISWLRDVAIEGTRLGRHFRPRQGEGRAGKITRWQRRGQVERWSVGC